MQNDDEIQVVQTAFGMIKVEDRMHKKPPAVYMMFADPKGDKDEEEEWTVAQYVDIDFFPEQLRKMMRTYLRGKKYKPVSEEEANKIMDNLVKQRMYKAPTE